MTQAYTIKLGLTIQKTDLRAQKINSLLLEIYGMALTRCLRQISLKKVQFFEIIFLPANINIEIILRIFFLSLHNVEF